MKKLIFFVILGFAFGFSSCNKDNTHTSFLGSWNCEEYSDVMGQRIYQVSITRNQYIQGATNEYIITNFHNLGFTESTEVYARENNQGVLTITGTSAIGILFTGTGKAAVDFSSIEWIYEVNDGGNNPKVRATYY